VGRSTSEESTDVDTLKIDEPNHGESEILTGRSRGRHWKASVVRGREVVIELDAVGDAHQQETPMRGGRRGR
jgi:hypothetical protein